MSSAVRQPSTADRSHRIGEPPLSDSALHAGGTSMTVPNGAGLAEDGYGRTGAMRWKRNRPSPRQLEMLGYVVVIVSAMVAVIGPSNLAWSDGFIGAASDVPDTPLLYGDHLQVAYNLWLWYDGIVGGGHWPWIDPYLFGAQGDGMVLVFGWPLVLVTVPVTALAGPVAAYNALVYLGFVLAAVLTACWLRSLSLSPVAAAAGGLVYAFAPFRVVQGGYHATALLAWMFPLLLLCLERALRGPDPTARRWGVGAVVTLVSIALSGEMHHAVFASLLVACVLALRLRGTSATRVRALLPVAVVGVVGLAAAALMMYTAVIRASTARGGRTMDETSSYAPRLVDFVRPSFHALERYTYLGATSIVLSLVAVGLAVVRPRHRALTITLAIGLVVSIWFSVAPSFTSAPWLQDTYRWVPMFSFSRAPGRLMIVGTLLGAGLVAVAVDHAGTRGRAWIVLIVAALTVADLPRGVGYERLSSADDPYRDLADGAAILELPVFAPGDQQPSVYNWLVTTKPGPRVGGYFVIVPEDLDEARRQATALHVRLDDRCAWRDLLRLAPVDYVAVHQRFASTELPTTWEATLLALPGVSRAVERDGVTIFSISDPTFRCVGRS